MKVAASGMLVGDQEERGATPGLTGNIDESNPILSTTSGEVSFGGSLFLLLLNG